MYPDLSYFLHDLIGTSRDNAFSIVKTFGLFLGITFFVMAIVLYLELKRKEKEGLLKPTSRSVLQGAGPKWSDVVINGIVGFLLGFKVAYVINNFAEFKADAAGVIFSSKGNVLIGIVSLLVFGGYVYWLGIKNKLEKPKLVKEVIYPHQKAGDMIIVAAVSGIIGSRVFSILENLDSFFKDPIEQLLSGSGLTVYGGLIFGTIAVAYYIKKHGVSILHGADSIAPALMLGYGVGRMGCQFSGDGDWGIVNEAAKPSWFIFPDWAWAYEYPHNVLNEGIKLADCVGNYCRQLSPPVFPTPLYEITFCILAFGLMWYLRNKIKAPGISFTLFLILIGIERFFIEFIRINPTYDYFGYDLSQAQYLSIFMWIIGIGAIYYLNKKHKKTTGTLT